MKRFSTVVAVLTASLHVGADTVIPLPVLSVET